MLGTEIIDTYLLDLINHLEDYSRSHYSDFLGMAKALGGVFSIFALAGHAYSVISEQKAFNILTIMRPLAIGLVIIFWEGFLSILGFVPKAIDEYYFRPAYEVEAAKVSVLKERRLDLAMNMEELIRQKRAAAEAAANQENSLAWHESIISYAKDLFETVGGKLAQWAMIKDTWSKHMLESLAFWFCEFIWQVLIYLLFFIRVVFLGILGLFGPITFAFSILPAWKDAWVQWTGRYIGILLYSSLGYFVLAYALQAILYGITKDIMVLEAATSSLEAFASYTTSQLGTACMYFVSLLVGALSLRFVPEIATWIIPASATHPARELMAGVQSQVTTATKAAVALM